MASANTQQQHLSQARRCFGTVCQHLSQEVLAHLILEFQHTHE